MLEQVLHRSTELLTQFKSWPNSSRFVKHNTSTQASIKCFAEFGKLANVFKTNKLYLCFFKSLFFDWNWNNKHHAVPRSCSFYFSKRFSLFLLCCSCYQSTITTLAKNCAFLFVRFRIEFIKQQPQLPWQGLLQEKTSGCLYCLHHLLLLVKKNSFQTVVSPTNFDLF